MEILRDVAFLRGVQLIFIILAGILFVFLGYKLFHYGVDKGRSKLRVKSEIYKLIFSGSGPGLLFMIFGGLVVIYSIYMLGIPTKISNLQNELSGLLEKPSTPLYVDIEQPDTTHVKERLSEAAFPGISITPTTARTNTIKSKNNRTIKRSLNLAKLESLTKKSQYRNEKELSRVINKHNSAIEYCFKKEAKKNPTLNGDLEVEFTIGYNGQVKSVNIVKSSMYNRNIEKCISNRIRGWRFKPIAEKEGDVKVRQKYIFG